MPRVPTTIKRAIRGVSEPHIASLLLGNWAKMLQDGRFKPLYGSVFETLLTPGSNPYLDALSERSQRDTVVCDVLDFRMALDVSDAGLSKTLLHYGVREELSTHRFKHELQRLKRETEEEIQVLEIGANIGYYTLVETTALGDRGHVYAVEPVPRNVDLLRENLELNGVRDCVSVDQLALGTKNDRAELYVSPESNWHSVNRIRDHYDSIEVDMLTVERFLSAWDVSTDQLHVVRADLEGFEVELFQELDGVLASEAPLLLFVELHPSFRAAHELNQVVDVLSENDFTIVSAAVDVYGNRFDRGWYAEERQIESFDNLKVHNRRSDAAVELIVKKEPV